MNPHAMKCLASADPKLGHLIRKVGPVVIETDALRSPYQALVEAVVYQQLTGKAAATILKRFKALFPRKRFPVPSDVLVASDDTLRSAGLSRAKVAAIKDIALKTEEGLVPSSRAIERLGDAEIIERLTAIRGVGQWTVEMLLIFKLRRPDILPATDYGIRKGFALTYGRAELPTPRELLEFGERWRPHRTTAAWYLWRAVDLARIRETQ